MTIKTYFATFAVALTGSSIPYVMASVNDEINRVKIEATATGFAIGSAVPVPPESVALDCLGPHHVGPHFDTGKSELTDVGLQVVADLYTRVDASVCVLDDDGLRCGARDVGFEIYGHADERISLSIDNQDLSERRAYVVAEDLRAWGARIVLVEGVGARKPAPAPEPDHRSSAQRWKEDRRATIRLTCEGRP